MYQCSLHQNDPLPFKIMNKILVFNISKGKGSCHVDIIHNKSIYSIYIYIYIFLIIIIF